MVTAAGLEQVVDWEVDFILMANDFDLGGGVCTDRMLSYLMNTFALLDTKEGMRV
jgi:hypothetical protein